MKSLLKRLLYLITSLLIATAILLNIYDYYLNRYKVTKVVDGDTINVQSLNPFKNKDKTLEVRYIGIDSPEISQGKEPHQCYAEEAFNLNKELVLKKTVKLEFDVNKIDRFGRYLAYVYIDDYMVNKTLLEKGAAKFFLDTVNLRYQQDLINLANQAHQEKAGLWTECAKNKKQGCNIKGNLDKFDKRWYHLPNFRHYNQAVVNLENGDQWFCSEEEAIKAGFEKARE